MKKVLSLLVAVLFLAAICPSALAQEEGEEPAGGEEATTEEGETKEGEAADPWSVPEAAETAEEDEKAEEAEPEIVAPTGYPTAEIDRPLALPKMTLEPYVKVHIDIIEPDNWFGLRMGTGFGILDNIEAGGDPPKALERFITSLGDRIGASHRMTGGLIPVGGPIECVAGNVIMVGDAAGHTHPITGGGIHQAVEAGRMAGEAVAAYVSGDSQALMAYEDAFRSLFALPLGRATDRRRELDRGWAHAVSDPEAFKALMRRTWIGFKEFYKGEDVD